MRGLIELDYMLKKEAEEQEKSDGVDLEELKNSLADVYNLLDKISLQIAEKEQEKTTIEEIKEEVIDES